MGIPFYASIRVGLKQRSGKLGKIIKTRKIKSGKDITKVVGIIVDCTVVKTVDEPYRTAPLYFVYGYGIDDIRANLQYLKDMNKHTTYKFNGKSYQGLDQAIKYIERNKLENKLRNAVIDMWESIEAKFEVDRPKKKRK